MNPDTLARISTVSSAVKRPVYSSHSVMLFCSGCDTVTVGGGGAEPAVGLLSQPANTLPISISATKGTMRIMAARLQHIAIDLAIYLGDLIGPLKRRNRASVAPINAKYARNGAIQAGAGLTLPCRGRAAHHRCAGWGRATMKEIAICGRCVGPCPRASRFNSAR